MEPPSQIVVASANPSKVTELRAILETELGSVGSDVELLPRPPAVPEVVEDAPDFEGNARLKAVALASATGLAALADDSGLEVDGMGGAPGVRSARFAGEPADPDANLAKLISELENLSEVDPGRRARFRCTVVLRSPEGDELVASGTAEGRITSVERGRGGFGYDPVFVPDDGDGRTFGEMSSAEKGAISHRGRALRSLAAMLD